MRSPLFGGLVGAGSPGDLRRGDVLRPPGSLAEVCAFKEVRDWSATGQRSKGFRTARGTIDREPGLRGRRHAPRARIHPVMMGGEPTDPCRGGSSVGLARIAAPVPLASTVGAERSDSAT